MADSTPTTMLSTHVTPTQVVIDQVILRDWQKLFTAAARYALSGLHVYPCTEGKPGGMVATDGHKLVHVDMPHYTGPAVTFKVDGKLLKHDVLIIDFADALLQQSSSLWASCWDTAGTESKVFMSLDGKPLKVTILDMEFPDVHQVIPNNWGRGMRQGFGVNPAYLGQACKVHAPKQVSVVRFADPLAPLVMEGMHPNDASVTVSIVVMPMRVDDEPSLGLSGGTSDDSAKQVRKAMRSLQEELEQVREQARTEEANLRRQRDEALAERDALVDQVTVLEKQVADDSGWDDPLNMATPQVITDVTDSTDDADEIAALRAQLADMKGQRDEALDDVAALEEEIGSYAASRHVPADVMFPDAVPWKPGDKIKNNTTYTLARELGSAK